VDGKSLGAVGQRIVGTVRIRLRRTEGKIPRDARSKARNDDDDRLGGNGSGCSRAVPQRTEGTVELVSDEPRQEQEGGERLPQRTEGKDVCLVVFTTYALKIFKAGGK